MPGMHKRPISKRMVGWGLHTGRTLELAPLCTDGFAPTGSELQLEASVPAASHCCYSAKSKVALTVDKMPGAVRSVMPSDTIKVLMETAQHVWIKPAKNVMEALLSAPSATMGTSCKTTGAWKEHQNLK